MVVKRLPRRYRTQVLTGQILVCLAVFMAWPVPKPSLWILEGWGGLHLSSLLWAFLMGGVGLLLLLAQSPRWAMVGMMLAFPLLTTVAAAAYLTWGPNVMTVAAGPLLLHCAWTAIDLKARWRGP